MDNATSVLKDGLFAGSTAVFRAVPAASAPPSRRSLPDFAPRFPVKQAALSDDFGFDPFPFQRDDVTGPDVDVNRCEIADALVIASVIVMFDEGLDLLLESAGQEIFLQEDAVLGV